jgi:hypothetical protein
MGRLGEVDQTPTDAAELVGESSLRVWRTPNWSWCAPTPATLIERVFDAADHAD